MTHDSHILHLLADLDLNDKEEAMFRKGFEAGQAYTVAAVEAVLAVQKYKDTSRFRISNVGQ